MTTENNLPRTLLERYNSLIEDLEEQFNSAKEAFEKCAPWEDRIKYLADEVDRVKARLDFMIQQRDEIQASGRTTYEYKFGSVDDIRQIFANVNHLDSMFVHISKRFLEANDPPSKKVKYMENLVKVYDEMKQLKGEI